MERMTHPSEKSLEDSRQYCSKRYGRELTMEDVAEIHHNLAAYFRILAEWDAEPKLMELRPDRSSSGCALEYTS